MVAWGQQRARPKEGLLRLRHSLATSQGEGIRQDACPLSVPLSASQPLSCSAGPERDGRGKSVSNVVSFERQAFFWNLATSASTESSPTYLAHTSGRTQPTLWSESCVFRPDPPPSTLHPRTSQPKIEQGRPRPACWPSPRPPADTDALSPKLPRFSATGDLPQSRARSLTFGAFPPRTP